MGVVCLVGGRIIAGDNKVSAPIASQTVSAGYMENHRLANL